MTRYTPLWLQAGSYPAGNDRHLLNALWPAPASTGMAVTVQAGTMTVNIATGKVAVEVAGAGTALCVSDAVEQVTLPAAPGSGLNRYDAVICQARGNDIDGGANNDFVFTYVSSAVSASPAPPAIPANAAGLAMVYVPGGSASVTAGNITDTRPGGLTPMGLLNIPSSQVRLTSDISVPAQTQVPAIGTTGVAGHYYLVNWHMTVSEDAVDANNQVAGWLNDNLNPATNASGTSSVPGTGGWATLAGSVIWQCQAGYTTLQLMAFGFSAHFNIAASAPNGSSGATSIILLDLGTQAPT